MPDLALWRDPALMKSTGIAPCGKAHASKAAAVLIGGFASLKTHDPTAFAQHIIQLLSEYPADLVEDASIKVPREIEYLNIAALTSWLEARMTDRRHRHAEAVRERERVAKEAETRKEREGAVQFRAEYLAWRRDNPEGGILDYARRLANRF